MVVLDTDHISLLQEGDTSIARRLLGRILALPADEVGTTIITYEEQMRGWLGYLAKARSVPQQITAYGKLLRMLSITRRFRSWRSMIRLRWFGRNCAASVFALGRWI